MKSQIYIDRDKKLEIKRNQHGVPKIVGKTEEDIFWGVGHCHAKDRGLQMLLTRILGRGQASEHLQSTDEMLKFDIFFRQVDWAGHTEKEIANLTPKARTLSESYCDGVNSVLSKNIPWELRLIGYKPDPWTINDCILISRMIGYVSLCQAQGEVERFFVEMVQNGVPKEQLEELFPGNLNELDIELLKKVKIAEPIIPEEVKWSQMIPKMMASNNWVVSGEKTASGKPILANDPHLEVNRLPNLWYEAILKTDSRYGICGTMPGVPGTLVGRTNDLSWGVTFSFMDTIDSWIEECEEGKHRRGENEWEPWLERTELINRKNKAPFEITFFENGHGFLNGNPYEEGFYLATKWTGARSGAKSINAVTEMWSAKNVEEGMAIIEDLESTWNFVLADRLGNIGYQMTGLLPKRRQGVSGFIPLPGWNRENDWQGFVDPKDLPRAYNPEEGFFITANNNLNAFGKADPINISMADYRANQIEKKLKEKSNLTVEDMEKIQMDLHSLQAEKFMEKLRPLLPDTPQGEILKKWDCNYSSDSKGAYLFEEVYHNLFNQIFGDLGIGREVTEHLCRKSCIFTDFYQNFDKIMLSENSSWFKEKKPEELFRTAAEEALKIEPTPWKNSHNFVMRNIFFDGKLPKWLGFDKGPFHLEGGRATPHQGQIYENGTRLTSFGPSFRFVTDMGVDELHSTLAGGPSDRRFSKWYASEIKNWCAGKYKRLTP
ncbi:penicillin acylase family protein [Bdellovibrionota bacterium]